jgi:hypothetical protein
LQTPNRQKSSIEAMELAILQKEAERKKKQASITNFFSPGSLFLVISLQLFTD